MDIHRRIAFCGIAYVLVVACPVLAHHSTGLFDQSKVVSRTGTVRQFESINPHTWLHVDLIDENGKVATWSFEGAGHRWVEPIRLERGYRPPRRQDRRRVSCDEGRLARWAAHERDASGRAPTVLEPGCG